MPGGNQMRILIIDDEEDARMLLSFVVEPYNWQVVEAEDCWTGLEILKSDANFDLVLVDWQTPKMTGIEFITKVREELALQELKVIMTTGLNDTENVAAALSSGVNEYLMKPFTPDMVIDKIRMTGIDVPLNENWLTQHG